MSEADASGRPTDVRARIEAAADAWRADAARRRLVAELRAGLDAGMAKTSVARAAGISRPTLDAWLADLDGD